MPDNGPMECCSIISEEQMSEFPIDSSIKTDMATVMKNFGKQVSSTSISGQQQQQQQQVVKNTTSTSSSTSRVAKTSHSSSSQHVHHVTSSEMMKSDLSELKSSISEMKNLSGTTGFRLRSSREELDKDDLESENCDLKTEPLVTFPDPDTPPPVSNAVTFGTSNLTGVRSPNGLLGNDVVAGHLGNVTGNHIVASSSSAETVKFEQKRMTSASKMKVVTDSFTSDQALANAGEVKRVQTSDISYQEQTAASALRSRLEIEGVTAEKTIASKQAHYFENASRANMREFLSDSPMIPVRKVKKRKGISTAPPRNMKQFRSNLG
ncbi:hypothetical protein RUM43_005998 [Polyplax serrata]|uniref:Uncharacterized protein n=1 Tax=Polyplax serrata TaxID=468196 RepID=A0AAN8NXN2_POLSC